MERGPEHRRERNPGLECASGGGGVVEDRDATQQAGSEVGGDPKQDGGSGVGRIPGERGDQQPQSVPEQWAALESGRVRERGAAPEPGRAQERVAASEQEAVREQERVPEQRKAPVAECPRRAPADLLEHPDLRTAAEAAAVENLLRCWVREAGLQAPDDGTLRIPLPASGTALLAPVHYWSPTGWHRFGLPLLANAPEQSPPADAVTVAALLARETPADSGSDTADLPANARHATATGSLAALSSGPVTTALLAPLASGPVKTALLPTLSSAPVTTAIPTAPALGPAPTAGNPPAPNPGPPAMTGQPSAGVEEPAAATGTPSARTSASAPPPGVPVTAAPVAQPAMSNPPPGAATFAPATRAASSLASGTTPDLPSGMADCSVADAVPLRMTDAARGPATSHAPTPLSTPDLVARVADSLRRTVTFIRERRERPSDGPDLFLAAEQALLLGHPLHPTPKSREGLSETEACLYSPELRGSFPLCWLAVAPSVLATDSAWTERGRRVPAPQLMARLAGAELSRPEGYVVLPLHPWQLREVRLRSDTAALFDAGLLRDLGTHGPPWHPTSSVRTVYRSAFPAMLKLSLGLRITNSRRENLRKELHRGVEVHRLLRSGLSEQWRSAHPGFDIVRDPAWLAVDTPDGNPVPGLEVMIRHNPFSPSDDVSCIAGLVSPRPQTQAGGTPAGSARHYPETDPSILRSRLTTVVTRLAGRTGRPCEAVATEWFLRYLEQVVRPVLWLDAEAGIALEAHQQNTVLLLDADGWPAGGRSRDNQGYYFRESRRTELDARLPGIGEYSDTFVSDEVTDERFAYYLAINNVFGLIGAFGSQRLADERLLLAAFRRFLGDVATGTARLRTSLPAHLLDSPILRCKANLLTRLHGLDELVGPVDTQSVYVTIANPLHS